MSPPSLRPPAELPADEGAAAEPTTQVRAVRSEALFNGAQEVQIEHRGAVYRLRHTALGKLILTK